MVDIQENIDLHSLTTFRVGGKAQYFSEVKSENDLIEVLKWAKEKDIPVFILGGGSNVLFSDHGWKGIVIKIKNSDRVIGDDGRVQFGAGSTLSSIIEFAKDHGFGGVERLAGIPGTLGGAVRGNAGAFGSDISQGITTVRALDRNALTISEYKKEHCEFGYRTSFFKKHPEWIVLSAELKFVSGMDTKVLERIMHETIETREQKHPQRMLCAGSFFVNPKVTNEHLRKEFELDTGMSAKDETLPAGWLIDHVGLRGKEIGGAKVSNIHPNYIVNTGAATAESILILASLIKQRVRTELGIRLREEVQLVGF